MEQCSVDSSRRFLWGMVLACMPSLAFLLEILNILRALPEPKGAGLGAVAGGTAEAFITLGMLSAVVLPIAAIVMLTTSFSKLRPLQKFVCALSIAWCSLILLFYAGGVYASFAIMRASRQ
jgi:hypothetical protein